MYKVKKAFNCKESYARYEAGDEYTPSSEERANELTEKGYLEGKKPARKRSSKGDDK